jgi:hypothetical protein
MAIGIISLSIFFGQSQNCDPVMDAHSSPNVSSQWHTPTSFVLGFY